MQMPIVNVEIVRFLEPSICSVPSVMTGKGANVWLSTAVTKVKAF